MLYWPRLITVTTLGLPLAQAYDSHFTGLPTRSALLKTFIQPGSWTAISQGLDLFMLMTAICHL